MHTPSRFGGRGRRSEFGKHLDALIAPLDAETHAGEIARLRRCQKLADLTTLSDPGWLSPESAEPRLKLVRHPSGTFLVVAYTADGWSSRLSMEGFPG